MSPLTASDLWPGSLGSFTLILIRACARVWFRSVSETTEEAGAGEVEGDWLSCIWWLVKYIMQPHTSDPTAKSQTGFQSLSWKWGYLHPWFVLGQSSPLPPLPPAQTDIFSSNWWVRAHTSSDWLRGSGGFCVVTVMSHHQKYCLFNFPQWLCYALNLPSHPNTEGKERRE